VGCLRENVDGNILCGDSRPRLSSRAKLDRFWRHLGTATSQDGAPPPSQQETQPTTYPRLKSCAWLSMSSAVCASRSSTATSPSSKAKHFGEKTSTNPTTSRSYRMGATTIERMPSLRQIPASTLGSISVSSQRNAFPVRMHSRKSPNQYQHECRAVDRRCHASPGTSSGLRQ